MSYVTGTIKDVQEKSLIIETGGFGLFLHAPQAQKMKIASAVTLYTHLHWNQENGPSLFGFQTPLDRQVFLMIIDCPKIGPSIALSVLSYLTAGQFLECVTRQDEKQLSKVNGIGPKKAEQLIVQLKHKVQKLVASGSVTAESQESFVHWQQVRDVLDSLNYSKSEVNHALDHLSEKYQGSEQRSLDQLIRSALSFLSLAK